MFLALIAFRLLYSRVYGRNNVADNRLNCNLLLLLCGSLVTLMNLIYSNRTITLSCLPACDESSSSSRVQQKFYLNMLSICRAIYCAINLRCRERGAVKGRWEVGKREIYLNVAASFHVLFSFRIIKRLSPTDVVQNPGQTGRNSFYSDAMLC